MKITKFYCDECEGELPTQRQAEEYSGCKARNLTVEYLFSGHVSEGCTVGFEDTVEKELLLCVPCAKKIKVALVKLFKKGKNIDE